MKRTPQSIYYRWDNQPGSVAGWYVTAEDAYGVVTDSAKSTFPVDVDEFDRGEERELVAALREAFPKAHVSAPVGI